MLVAEQQFRRIIGYRDLATLVIAIERHADRVNPDHSLTVCEWCAVACGV